jgi:hypothetical protein
MSNKMQQCRMIYCSLAALHVLTGIFAHHQEHLNFIYSVWYYTRESLPAGFMGDLELQRVPTLPWNRPATTHVYNTRRCKYTLDAPDYERKYRLKFGQQPRNNKLSYTVKSFWSFSYINLLKTKLNLLYIRNQSVPRCKHFPPRL